MKKEHNPPLVLIADDQIPTTIMLERIFEYENYQVKSVYDGISAVQAAHDLLPDLILLDVNMPGMNGFDVLRKLRENSATSNIPTILITAMGEMSNIVQGLQLGADDYLRKPFNHQELLARAQSKMKSRKLEETLQRRTQELEALLRVSEELNQHLETEDLLKFILYLALDLLPGEIAAIYQVSSDKRIINSHIMSKTNDDARAKFDEGTLYNFMAENRQALIWPDESSPALFPEFESGLVASMLYGGKIHGLILIVNNEPYDENHLRLFTGISTQATLALRNAELYEIQANYALHLEDMVASRTAELQSAQQMLIRSEKLASVGRLAASIAHEINNPLLPIQINLEHMLEDIEFGDKIQAEDIKKTQESVERIRRIVNRLLEFTGKRQMGETTLQSLDINALIESVMSLNRKFFQQEGLSIDMNLAPLPQISGNKDQLEQVLMNLALNAKAAMSKGGKLKVTTSSVEDAVVIEMQDTGHGIPQDMIDRIFEPFVSTKEEGTGLGLFISHGIIENHNGSIQVESEPGKGSNFIVRLPISTKQEDTH